MALSPKKDKEVAVCFPSPRGTPPISSNCKQQGSRSKVLRVTIQSNLKWDIHVNEVVSKGSKRLYIPRVLKRSGVPSLELLRVLFAVIRSVLEYCCPVWHSSLSDQLSDRIKRVQKRALRIIYPALHYHEALEISRCTTLHTRREALCAKTFDKIKELGSRLCHPIPPTRESAHGRSFSSLCYSGRPSLFERFKKSVFPVMCLHAQPVNDTFFLFLFLNLSHLTDKIIVVFEIKHVNFGFILLKLKGPAP